MLKVIPLPKQAAPSEGHLNIPETPAVSLYTPTPDDRLETALAKIWPSACTRPSSDETYSVLLGASPVEMSADSHADLRRRIPRDTV